MSLATHRGHSKDSDQTGRMPRLIRFFGGRHKSCCLFCHAVVHFYSNEPRYSEISKKSRANNVNSDQRSLQIRSVYNVTSQSACEICLAKEG